MSNPNTSGRASAPTSQDEEWTRARQVIQHFFSKAALTVASYRCSLPRCFVKDSSTVKTDRWFNLVLDDCEGVQEDVRLWSTFNLDLGIPPPLYLEICLDPTDLPQNQTIVVIDERGQRWNACEALKPHGSSTDGSRGRPKRGSKVVLERWKISLTEDPSVSPDTFEDAMATVYKKAVVLFRTLFTQLHSMPACSFNRRLAKEPASLNSLRPSYKISINEPSKQDRDALEAPLYPSAEQPFQQQALTPVATPAGLMDIEVTYRSNCDFRVDDADALLSVHWMMGLESQQRPSTFGEQSGKRMPYHVGVQEPGSLPAARQGGEMPPPPNPAYGSLSTFHQVGAPTGTSPVSALRAAREFNSSSLADSPPARQPPDHRSSQSSKSSLRPVEGAPTIPRRVSVSFQPFKAGSLSSSPGPSGTVPLSPKAPSGDASNTSSGVVSHGRKPSSQNSIPQSALRGVTSPSEQAAASPVPGSPKAPPMQRFSSSFSHRRSRFSSGGGSAGKPEEVHSSSEKNSQASNQPGSGLMAEGHSGSSESIHADDDNISDFLGFIEAKKNLKSLNRTDDASREASARRTNAALSKFQKMRDSHAALSESISTSMMPPAPASNSPGRQPSSVPPQLAGASVSTSSSPGKDVSPRTPHTPAVPSRLSSHATVGHADSHPPRRSSLANQRRNESQPTSRTPGPIDIPTSPRRYHRPRTFSSAAQRNPVVEDELGMRSASVPTEAGGQELSMSELFNAHDPSRQSSARAPRTHRPRQGSREEEDRRTPNDQGSRPSSYRPRFTRGGASGRGSYSSIGTGSGQASGSADAGHPRQSTSSRPGLAAADDEEPLLFAMSELEQQSRRSLEEQNKRTS